MTLPRRVLPGTTYFVSRRCFGRQFLLKPSPVVRQVLTYALAYAAQVHGVEVHGWIVLSNHLHLVCTDVRGELPKFMQLMNVLIARALNFHYGRSESFWAPGSYSAIPLTDTETLLDKLSYMFTNAVGAGLVARPEQWPGVHTLPEDMGTLVLEVERPGFFFRNRGADESGEEKAETARARARRRAGSRDPLPERVELRFTLPPLLREGMTLAQAQALARSALEAYMERILEERRARRERRFLGAKAVLAQSPFDTPWGSAVPDGSLNPRIACRDRWRRQALTADLVQFYEEHRKARQAFQQGKHRVLFPAGTWYARVMLGARVRPPDDPP